METVAIILGAALIGIVVGFILQQFKGHRERRV